MARQAIQLSGRVFSDRKERILAAACAATTYSDSGLVAFGRTKHHFAAQRDGMVRFH